MTADISPVLIFSGKILLASFLTNLALGTWAGVYLARRDGFASRVLDIVISLPLVFPPIALGFFLLLVFGRNSPLGRFLGNTLNLHVIFSAAGVFIAAFLAGFPLMVKSVSAAAAVIEPSIIEMACIQGASPFQIALYVIIPNLRMGVLSGLALSTARSLGEVGMTLMLGGNITGKTETLSLAIYNAVFEGNFSRAGYLSFIVALLAVLFFIAIQKFEKKDIKMPAVF